MNNRHETTVKNSAHSTVAMRVMQGWVRVLKHPAPERVCLHETRFSVHGYCRQIVNSLKLPYMYTHVHGDHTQMEDSVMMVATFMC